MGDSCGNRTESEGDDGVEHRGGDLLDTRRKASRMELGGVERLEGSRGVVPDEGWRESEDGEQEDEQQKSEDDSEGSRAEGGRSTEGEKSTNSGKENAERKKYGGW